MHTHVRCIQGNEAEPAGVCAIGPDFVDVVAEPHTDWEWVDEGMHGEHKWGYVSSQVGSTRFWYMFVCMWCVVNNTGCDWVDKWYIGAHKWGYISSQVGQHQRS